MSVTIREGGRRIFNSPRLDQMRVELLTHLAEHGEQIPSKLVRDYITALEITLIGQESQRWIVFAGESWDQWGRPTP